MSEGQVHPAVVIEVETRDAEGRPTSATGPWIADPGTVPSLGFSKITTAFRSRSDQVDGAVIVVVTANRREQWARAQLSRQRRVTSVNVPSPLLRHIELGG